MRREEKRREEKRREEKRREEKRREEKRRKEKRKRVTCHVLTKAKYNKLIGVHGRDEERKNQVKSSKLKRGKKKS